MIVRCRDCQPLMLEYAYGLLDTPAAEAIRGHIATCPECTAAASEASRQQALLGHAAKLNFANAKFEMPKNEVASPVAKPKKKRSWTPWAIAASVLIVGGAVSLPLMQDRSQPPSSPGVEVAKVTPSVPNGRDMLEGVGNAKPPMVVTSNSWTQPAAGTEPAFKIKITGNDALTVGVPNEYSIVATEQLDKKAKVSFVVTLNNAKEAVLFSRTFTHYSLVNLPVKDAADSPLTLHIRATDAAGHTAEWTQSLPVVTK